MGPGNEARFHRPLPRPTWMRRARLSEALTRAASVPVTLVSAPAGYGKTVAVAQWLAEPDSPTAVWLTLHAEDDVPDRLWAHLGAALALAGSPLGDTSRPPDAATFSDVRDGLAAAPDGLVLVLDDFHCVRSRTGHEQVQRLLADLAPQVHLVILTRHDPGLRLGRLRASGDLAELRAHDLRLTTPEAGQLLAAAGVELDDASVTTLVERCEGWPAALYLASLSLRTESDPAGFVRRFGAGSRFVGDYLVEEVLSRQDERVRRFIATAALLEHFCPSLCDHVAGTHDSASVLAELERSDLFVVPVDAAHRWFRLHHLLGTVARSELELEAPEAVRRLHLRAADWFIASSRADEAVRHLLAAGRLAEAADLVRAHWFQQVGAGRVETVADWLEALGTRAVETNDEVRVAAAWVCALSGDPSGLGHHLSVLERAEDGDEVSPGDPGAEARASIRCATLLLRGLFAPDGPLDARDAARRALSMDEDQESPHRAVAHLALGHAAYLLGDLDVALAQLRAAASSRAAPALVVMQSLSLQSLLEDERGDLESAALLAERAVEVARERAAHPTGEVVLPATALGLAQAAAGKVESALVGLQEVLGPPGARLLVERWAEVHHLVATARVAALAGQDEVARDLLDRSSNWLERFPRGTEAMRVRLERVRALLRHEAAAVTFGEALTRRELDVLRLLPSELSPQQIADELFLTLNTVKTHAGAVYRKLGVHSRAEAVVAARRQALL